MRSPHAASQTGSPTSRWVEAWSQTDPSVWTSIYAEDVSYTDYAFGFVRRGKKGLEDHFNIWRTSNPNFQATIAEEWPPVSAGEGRTKYSMRTNNVGTFEKDLPSLKANGKDWEFVAVVDLVVKDEDGLIEKVEEWYNYRIDRPDLIERDAKL